MNILIDYFRGTGCFNSLSTIRGRWLTENDDTKNDFQLWQMLLYECYFWRWYFLMSVNCDSFIVDWHRNENCQKWKWGSSADESSDVSRSLLGFTSRTWSTRLCPNNFHRRDIILNLRCSCGKFTYPQSLLSELVWRVSVMRSFFFVSQKRPIYLYRVAFYYSNEFSFWVNFLYRLNEMSTEIDTFLWNLIRNWFW